MPAPLGAVPGIQPSITPSSLPRPGAATGFADTLSKVVASVEGASGEANTAVNAMIDGTGDVHTAMIALQRAETALQVTVQVRNKLVQAYQDIMRMPV